MECRWNLQIGSTSLNPFVQRPSGRKRWNVEPFSFFAVFAIYRQNQLYPVAVLAVPCAVLAVPSAVLAVLASVLAVFVRKRSFFPYLYMIFSIEDSA